MYLRSESTQFSIIIILAISLTSMFSMIFTNWGIGLWDIDYAFAQNLDSNIIQIIGTSTFIDDFGNFHVIGEVNNTSFDPQTDIVITTILSDTTNNVIVGNHSAFSSISTLRQTELSPFDIIIQDPQILGKFNFMEFSTTSQPAIEKPANLVLNGTSAFLDNIGNPHITGNIINQGQFPEQFLNLVATFYDNSSLGVVGTQSFGLNVGNLTQNQMTPFDITIFDNKTKSQGKFYSLDMDSTQSSMTFPTSTKFPFNNDGFGGGGVGTGFIDSGGSLFTTPPPISDNQGFVNDDNIGQSPSSGSSNGNGNFDPSPTGAELDIEIDVENDPLVRGNIQTIDVIVSDESTQEKIGNANTDLRVFYTTDFDKVESGQTNNNGVATFEIEIGPGSNTGNFDVTATVNAAGYTTETDRTTFEVIEELDDTNETSSQNNTTDSDNNNGTGTNDSEEQTNGNTNQNEDAEIEPLIDQEQQEQEEQNENSNNEGDSGEDGSSDNSNSDEVNNEQNDSNSDDSGGNEN
ncbi:hypothetical protein NARC_100119 [Candidatus Nitrosocosmicus arcticus]|uniref:Uncharacterized protein n=2 Tax=Candidatus Nitrosocosmicus arcticus TaxID=2035267 RepID=A0A557STX6_9ARCH|nr:hypothetical protein NARC_100119 [Candidatus Nitrosocosmicus arcticus]